MSTAPATNDAQGGGRIVHFNVEDRLTDWQWLSCCRLHNSDVAAAHFTQVGTANLWSLHADSNRSKLNIYCLNASLSHRLLVTTVENKETIG